MTARAATLPAHSIDAFLGGQITLVQPSKGHRAGLDAALLQAIVPADAAGHAIDFGAGAGAVAFSAAARAPALEVTAVEREPELVRCAKAALKRPENTAFADRVRFVESEIAAWRESERSLPPAADFVLMNPPFDQPGRVRASPDAVRRVAHIADASTIHVWCRTAAKLLKAGGVLGLIHRTEALHDVLEALSGRAGDLRILPVYPSANAPAKRIIVRGVKGSRAGVKLLPGLILHEAGGAWTSEADRILRGLSELHF